MSEPFRAAFEAALAGRPALPWREFMALALFDPACGYYRAPRQRVGRTRSADFYTATSVGPVFGRCVAGAAETLALAANPQWTAEALTFVELGAEPSGGVLRGVPHHFKAVRETGLSRPGGAAAALAEAAAEGPLVVFSNELFDAQPFERWVRTREGWREAGVARRDGAFTWVLLDTPTPDWLAADPTAATAPEGYLLDAPTGGSALLEALLRTPWTGLFIAFDYGLDWQALISERPEGTGRAYHQHSLVKDLLLRPGEQDLTAHVCWTWLADTLSKAGCSNVEVRSQESFLVRNAGATIAALSAEGAADPARGPARALMELLHPARMGQKFQVLTATKRIVA